PMTLAIVSDNGSADPGDDWGAYVSGPLNVPNTGEGWRSLEWDIKASSPTLPAGWLLWDIGAHPPPNRSWAILMRNVAQVPFLYAPPGTIRNFPVWNTGVDNIAIVDCYANCDGSTITPHLNVMDYVCFLNQYASGVSYANCDQSTLPPLINVNDFS